jgi:hypothetical protein
MTEDVRPESGTPEWIEHWADIIAKEQAAGFATIAGDDYPRIRYGADYPDAAPNCWDCGVEHGQIHVWGCCVECCARCKEGQMLTCGCGEH